VVQRVASDRAAAAFIEDVAFLRQRLLAARLDPSDRTVRGGNANLIDLRHVKSDLSLRTERFRQADPGLLLDIFAGPSQFRRTHSRDNPAQQTTVSLKKILQAGI